MPLAVLATSPRFLFRSQCRDVLPQVVSVAAQGVRDYEPGVLRPWLMEGLRGVDASAIARRKPAGRIAASSGLATVAAVVAEARAQWANILLVGPGR